MLGGLLVQERDREPLRREDADVVCGEIGDEAWDDLLLAWRVVKHVASNAIVLARDGRTIGIGAGQTSRVDAVRIAVEKANELGHRLEGAVLASDAFFPFADGPELALEAGVAALIQPGGSKRDDEVIAAVEAAGAAMAFTEPPALPALTRPLSAVVAGRAVLRAVTGNGIRFSSAEGRWVLATAVLGSAVAFLEATVVNVALPEIGRDLDADLSGLSVDDQRLPDHARSLILLGGSLGDRYGRRRIFEIGCRLVRRPPPPSVPFAPSIARGAGRRACRPGRRRRPLSPPGASRSSRHKIPQGRPRACDRRLVRAHRGSAPLSARSSAAI